MGCLEEHHGPFLPRKFSKPFVPVFPTTRRKSEKHELIGRKPRSRERRGDGIGARNRDDNQFVLPGRSDQPRARIRDPRRAGIGDEGDRVAFGEPGNQSRRFSHLVVLAKADERPPDLIVRQQFRGAPGVFRGDEIDFPKGSQRPERQVLEVADRRRDHVQGHTDGQFSTERRNLWKTRKSAMPLYEYQCDDCGKRFERIQKFSDPPVDKCPTCEGVVRKLISSPAIQFKGSGWYITDYARKGEPSGGGSTESGKDSSASKDGSESTKESSNAKEASKEPSKAGSSESAKPAAEKATPGSKT